jgi:hypothetical protein
MATNPINELMKEFGQEVVERAMLNLGVYRTVNGKKRRAVASDNLRKSLTYRYDLSIRHSLKRVLMVINQTTTLDSHLEKSQLMWMRFATG